MNSILNPMLNTAIDNLSDSDSDLDDYTAEKVRKNGQGLRYNTRDEFKISLTHFLKTLS